MARRANSSSKAVSRVAGAVKKTAKKLTSRLRKPKAEAAPPSSAAASRREAPKKPAASPARKRRPQTDIPAGALNRYTPTQTSLKAGFRANGADRQRDQEFVRGVADERWNEEDRLTNKSGDPRIGTHGRTYEPGEKKRATSKGRR
jgi:hypothetical protein